MDQSRLNKSKWQANLMCKTAPPITIRADSWGVKTSDLLLFSFMQIAVYPGIKFTGRKEIQVFLSLCNWLDGSGSGIQLS